MKQVGAILWEGWKAKNRELFQGSEVRPDQILAAATALLNSYVLVQQNRLCKLRNPVKVNVDASFNSNSERGGLGVVIRDWNGKVLLAATKKELDCVEIEHLEAKAITYGLQCAEQAKYFPIMIESDALNVINLVLGKISSLKEIGWFIQDIQKSAAKLNFVKF